MSLLRAINIFPSLTVSSIKIRTLCQLLLYPRLLGDCLANSRFSVELLNEQWIIHSKSSLNSMFCTIWPQSILHMSVFVPFCVSRVPHRLTYSFLCKHIGHSPSITPFWEFSKWFSLPIFPPSCFDLHFWGLPSFVDAIWKLQLTLTS